MADPTFREILDLLHEVCVVCGVDKPSDEPLMVLAVLANRHLLLQQKVDEQASLIEHLAECEAGLARQLDERSDEPEQIRTYRSFLHHLQAAIEVTLDAKRVQQLVDAACAWSRADRTDPGEHGRERPSEAELVDILRRGMAWTNPDAKETA